MSKPRRFLLLVFAFALLARVLYVGTLYVKPGARDDAIWSFSLFGRTFSATRSSLWAPDAASYDALAQHLLAEGALFDAELSGLPALDEGGMPESLRELFAYNTVPLSAQAKLVAIQKGSAWRVADGEKSYTIRREGSRLRVYHSRGYWMRDFPGLTNENQEGLVVYSFRPCLFPLLLARVYAIFGHHYLPARLLMALVSAATCLLVYVLGRRLFDERIAMVSMLLCAFYPRFIFYSGGLSTETLAIAFVLLTTWLFLRAHEAPERWPRWILAGGVLGLAILCRSMLLTLPAFVLVWLLVVTADRWKAIVGFTIATGTTFAVMSPWIARNRHVHHRLVPATTEGGYTFWVTNNPKATGGGECFWPEEKERARFRGLSEVEIDKELYRLGLEYVRGNPGGFLKLCVAKFCRLWRLWPHVEHVGWKPALVAGATFTPVLLLGLWGLVVTRERWRSLLLLYLLFVYYTGIHCVFMAVTRYRAPIVPLLMLFAACGLMDLLGRTRLAQSAAGAGACGRNSPEVTQTD